MYVSFLFTTVTHGDMGCDTPLIRRTEYAKVMETVNLYAQYLFNKVNIATWDYS